MFSSTVRFKLNMCNYVKKKKVTTVSIGVLFEKDRRK